jgi:hypothetical protein
MMHKGIVKSLEKKTHGFFITLHIDQGLIHSYSWSQVLNRDLLI